MSRYAWHLIRVAVSPLARLAAVVAHEFAWHHQEEGRLRSDWRLRRDPEYHDLTPLDPARPPRP